jgi:hypothetical protein
MRRMLQKNDWGRRLGCYKNIMGEGQDALDAAILGR